MSVKAHPNSGQPVLQRQSYTIRGIVQGVGFRPFVYRLASDLSLAGFVRNQSGSVFLEVEGSPGSLERFAIALTETPPPLARIESIESHVQRVEGTVGFHILESEDDSIPQIFVPPDMATCDECLAELFNPVDRRYRYPFLNCTNCGPRLTIIRGTPYDRQQTTMSSFKMCSACRAEYEDPRNRRFHAQPVACPQCGPQLLLLTSHGDRIESSEPLLEFANAIRAGKIGAMKGLGGFHLICDATNESAVARLRQRKHRDEKPFAIMVSRLSDVEQFCEINDIERSLLSSAQRPIVLLRRRKGVSSPQLAGAIAPENPDLGVMLPYTPLHHLLMDVVEYCPLVMTSGNRSAEPIVYLDQDIDRFSEIADLILTHDRPIYVRCDDSVTREIYGAESPLRRSRGYAPTSIALPQAVHVPMLAAGGQLKSTFSLGRDRSAFLSHHLGDLDDFSAYQAFERDIQLYESLFEISPQWIIHDLHPDYASTGYAIRRAQMEGLNLMAVQHHHAHLASCMAEHGLHAPVIGLIFDGTGYGPDNGIWGGEFLVADYMRFQRAAHLRYVGLPGGESAVREPWRMAAAHLIDAGLDLSLLHGFVPQTSLKVVERMIERNFNNPPTSSMGRLFDAAASLAGVRQVVSYEGQAAMELEWLAFQTPAEDSYPFELIEVPAEVGGSQLLIDTRPLIHALVDDKLINLANFRIARRFHSSILAISEVICLKLRQRWNLNQIVLSGGVFMNALLTTELTHCLEGHGFDVFRHQRVPCNDGGLSLGQLAIAAACILDQ